MNEDQILLYMTADYKISRYFRGIFAFDELPMVLEQGIYIVNTDSKYGRGKHWVVLSRTTNSRNIDYFDSLAGACIPYVLKLISKNNLKCVINTKRLQSLSSDVCGDYCIMFAFFACRGYSINEFVQMFTHNYSHNDNMVCLAK